MEMTTGWKANLGRRKNALHATVAHGYDGMIIGLSVRIPNPNILPRFSNETFRALSARVETGGNRGRPVVKSDLYAFERGQIEIGLNSKSVENARKAFNAVKGFLEDLITPQ
jgi:hypothetical protein